MPGTTRLMATPRSLALGVLLLRAREKAGFNQRELAERVGLNHSTVGRYETGERPPKPAKVAALLQACGVVGAEQDKLVRFASELNGSHWTSVNMPDRRLQLAALLEFERLATCAWSVAPLLVPGRLQTDDYARAIMTGAGLPSSEAEEMVTLRMGRRELVDHPDNPSKLVAIIGEFVLRNGVGGRGVMERQLRYLTAMANHPSVEIRVIPTDAGWHPALEGSFLLLDFALDTAGGQLETVGERDPDDDVYDDEEPGTHDHQQTPIVHLETRESSLFLHEPTNVAGYQQAVQMVLRAAMSPKDSVGLIAREADNQ